VNSTPVWPKKLLGKSVHGAITASQEREGTANIGFLVLGSGQHRLRYPESIDAIRPWATTHSWVLQKLAMLDKVDSFMLT
jgi:hypothetical protein